MNHRSRPLDPDRAGGEVSAGRHSRWFSPDEVKAVMAGIALGQTYREIAYPLGRTHGSVKGFVSRNGLTGRKIEWPIEL